MSDTPTRFPLAWPAGRPRRTARKNGSFRARDDRGWMTDITVARAMDRLEEEVRRLGGVNALLSSNLDTRLDGRPRSNGAKPADPGVCLYFTLKGEPMSMPCDVYNDVAQNIAALAAHIEAVRMIERHGVATGSETLQAFRALLAPVPEKPRKPWNEVFGVVPSAADEETIDALYRVKAKQIADDEDALSELNVARDDAKTFIRGRAGQLQQKVVGRV